MFNISNINKFNAQKKQKGISNVQLIVFIVVSGILLLGGISLLRQIDKAKVNNDVQELTDLKARTVAYGGQRGGSFTGVTIDTLAGLDFFPANRVAGAAGARTVQNQWKGTVAAAPATTITAGDSIEYTYSGVPTSACKDLAQNLVTVAAVISINGTAVKANGGALNEGTMITQCESAPDNASIAYRMTR